MLERERPRHMPGGHIILLDAVDVVGQHMFTSAWSDAETDALMPRSGALRAFIFSRDRSNAAGDIRDEIQRMDGPEGRRWKANERLRALLRDEFLPAFAFYDGALLELAPTGWNGDEIEHVFISGRVTTTNAADDKPTRFRALTAWERDEDGHFVLLVREHLERALCGEPVKREVTKAGAPGRPTSSMHLVTQEFDRRVKEKCIESTVAAEARHLEGWLKKNYPKAPPPTVKTIANRLSKERRAAFPPIASRPK